jgi:hypothetical protein
MTKTAISIAAVALAFAGGAAAKLPAPTEAQKAAAAEAAAKAAYANKVAAYELCESENRTAARYIAAQKAAGKTVTPQLTQACAHPGPFQAGGAAAQAAAPAPAAKAAAPAPAAKK